MIIGYYVVKGDWFYDPTNLDHPYAVPVEYFEGNNPIPLEVIRKEFYKDFPEQGRGYYNINKQTFKKLERLMSLK